jgi:hypothetical protein
MGEETFYREDVLLSSKSRSCVILSFCNIKICRDTFANGIRDLRLNECKIDRDEMKALIENNITIEKLVFIQSISNTGFIDFIGKNKTIKELEIGFRDECFEIHDLLKHRSLISLELAFNSAIGKSTGTTLRSLDIRGCRNISLSTLLEGNTTLTSLTTHSEELTSRDIELISNNKTLLSLHIYHHSADESKINTENVQSIINNNTTLTELKARANSLVISTKTLLRLDLSGSPLGDKLEISKNKSITCLKLSKDMIEEIFIKRYQDRIKLRQYIKKYLFKVFLF